MPDTLLVIEDEQLLGQELVRHYRRSGWEVILTPDLGSAERVLLQESLDPLVVLSDMSLPDGNALDLLERAKARGAGGEWILLTGYGSVPDSVRALRLGAVDFLEKPCDQQRLDLVLASAARSARAQRRLREETAAQTRRFTPDSFVGRSTAARQVRSMLQRLAEVPFTVLVINGETGTGKGLAARILHHSGHRAAGPLVELNCAALPRDLLESELFGHEAGAFTGAKGRHRGLLEQAQDGTLFLDEIAEMGLELQAKVLKAIEDRAIRRLGGEREIAIDVQIIAASNRDLTGEVREGRFRSDLYHRLSVFELWLPPLRERREDVYELTPLFVSEYNAKAGKSVREIPGTAWERLLAHDWPGNVRELRNAVERCVLFAEDKRFPEQWLQLGGMTRSSSHAPGAGAITDGDRLILPLDGSMALEDMERHVIKTALKRAGYNVTGAARALGTTRETLRYRIQKYDLKEGGD